MRCTTGTCSTAGTIVALRLQVTDFNSYLTSSMVAGVVAGLLQAVRRSLQGLSSQRAQRRAHSFASRLAFALTGAQPQLQDEAVRVIGSHLSLMTCRTSCLLAAC